MPSKLTMLRSWLTPCRVARHALLLLFTFCSLSVFAQTRVTGKVTNTTTNQPVAGASVQVEGTSLGVVTGDDGSFSINVPADRNNLVVSFIGFKQVVVPINN